MTKCINNVLWTCVRLQDIIINVFYTKSLALFRQPYGIFSTTVSPHTRTNEHVHTHAHTHMHTHTHTHTHARAHTHYSHALYRSCAPVCSQHCPCEGKPFTTQTPIVLSSSPTTLCSPNTTMKCSCLDGPSPRLSAATRPTSPTTAGHLRREHHPLKTSK